MPNTIQRITHTLIAIILTLSPQLLIYSCDQTPSWFRESVEEHLKQRFHLLSTYMPESIALKVAREIELYADTENIDKGDGLYEQINACWDLEKLLQQQTETAEPVHPVFAEPTWLGHLMRSTGIIHEFITDFVTGRDHNEQEIRDKISVITNGAWLLDFDEEDGIREHLAAIDREFEVFVAAGRSIRREQEIKKGSLAEQNIAFA